MYNHSSISFIFLSLSSNSAYADWKTLSPESSQHSRSQARVKEEGCVRFWQTSIKNSHSNGFETHKKLYKVVKAKVETGFRQAILMA